MTTTGWILTIIFLCTMCWISSDMIADIGKKSDSNIITWKHIIIIWIAIIVIFSYGF